MSIACINTVQFHDCGACGFCGADVNKIVQEEIKAKALTVAARRKFWEAVCGCDDNCESSCCGAH